MKARIEIIKARFKDETAPPVGTFKDLPIKDCMAIYAEEYAKKCLDIANKAVIDRGGYIFPGEDIIIGITLPDHD